MNTQIKKTIYNRGAKILVVLFFACVIAFLLPFSVYLLTGILSNLEFLSKGQLILSIVTYISVYLIANILVEALDYCERKTIQCIQFDLRKNLIDKMIKASYPYISNIRRGDMLSFQRMCDEAIFNLLFPFFGLVSVSVSIAVSGIFIMHLSVWIFLCLCPICIFWVLASKFLRGKTSATIKGTIYAGKKLNRYISQSISAKEDIVAWNKQEDIITHVRNSHMLLRAKLLKKVNLQTSIEQMDALIIISAIVMVFVFSNRFEFTVPQTIALYMYIHILFSALAKLNSVFQNKVIANINLEEINTILDAKEDYVMPILSKSADIKITNLNISFENKYILKDANFVLPAGKTTVLWGASGSGKTSLINAILGFSMFDGNIMWGDINCSRKGVCILRNNISFVPQEIKLFEGTIAQNIHLDEEYDEIRMDYVLQTCGLKKDGFTTAIVKDKLVTERGKNLSVGQRQRICIARALYIDKPIIIFDEPTHALDSECVDYIVSLIKTIKTNKLVLIATHDQQLKAVCDNIIYL